MASRTVIYDSSSLISYVGAAVVLNEYPFADQIDLSGLNKTQTDTAVAAVEASQDSIHMCVSNGNTDEVAEVVAQGSVEVVASAQWDVFMIDIRESGAGNLWSPLAVSQAAGANVTTTAAALVVYLNNATSQHGYTATNALGVITIVCPAGLGATANDYDLRITRYDGTGVVSTGISNMGGVVTGVTAVAFTAGTLQASQNTTLDGKMASGSATSVFTSGGKNTPLVAWESIYSGTVAPRLVTMLSGYNVIASDSTAISVLQATVPLLLTDIDVYGGVWERLLNWGDKVNASFYPVPDQDIDLLRLLSGEEFAEKRDNLV